MVGESRSLRRGFVAHWFTRIVGTRTAGFKNGVWLAIGADRGEKNLGKRGRQFRIVTT
jgi:hypothetical protein